LTAGKTPDATTVSCIECGAAFDVLAEHVACPYCGRRQVIARSHLAELAAHHHHGRARAAAIAAQQFERVELAVLDDPEERRKGNGPISYRRSPTDANACGHLPPVRNRGERSAQCAANS